jgi:hypothetical protein
MVVQLLDNEKTSTPGSNITITNNLWQGANESHWLHTAGGSGITISHNTVRNTTGWSPLYNIGPASVYLGQQWGQASVQFKDNIVDFGNYGFNANSSAGLAGAWPTNGPIEMNNVVINNMRSSTAASQLPRSFVVSDDGAVGFVNVGAGDSGDDYHGYALASTSPFKNRGSDGTDPGVNFTTLDTALASSGSGGGTGGSTPSAPSNLTVR